MRETLFRGKRIDNGEWVEGYLFANPISVYILPAGWEISPALDCIAVDHATVGQYTGLVDKNGRKIFEADRCEDSIRGAGVIKFSDGMYSIIYDKPTDPEWYESALFIADGDIEVIGNIHDAEATPCTK